MRQASGIWQPNDGSFPEANDRPLGASGMRSRTLAGRRRGDGAGQGAGPNRIQRLRREAESRGLDPNRWSENVEMVVDERVGSEPVRYVSNIYKHFIAYSLEQPNETQRREHMNR